jgi:hypothetical protein
MKCIAELSRRLACRAIGMPILVERFHDRQVSYRLQFPPFEPAGGIVLQKKVDFSEWGEYFCSQSEEDVRHFAAGIVADMRYLWEAQSSIARRVASVRQIADRIASQTRDVGVRAITIETNREWQGWKPSMSVEFDTWDHTLRRGIVVQEFSASEGQKILFSRDEIDRAALVEQTHALSAHGRIEGLARAIANAAPQGPDAVLADLANHFETAFVLSTDNGSLRCRLYWWRGVITAEARGSIGLEVRPDSVTISNRALPEAVATALAGKPLHVVFDRPFRCDTPIEAIEQVRKDIEISTGPDFWLVNCDTGRTWREAPTDGS